MANIDEIKFIRTSSSKLEQVQEDYPESFIHLHDEDGDGETVKDDLYIGDCRMTDNFNIGDMDESTATIKVAGLEASTLGELKKKSMSQILMDMVCPLTYPSVKTSPSVSISYSGSKLIKVGEILPSKDDIAVLPNGGKWSDGTAYYGDCSSYVLSMTPDKWSEASEEGIYVISGTCTFEAGGMSKDSHGNDYKQMDGGTVSSNSINIVSVYPVSINDSDITVMTERLVDYNTLQTIYVTVPAEVDGTLDKFKVNLPYKFSTFDVHQLNPVSGKYDIEIKMVLMDGEDSKYIRTLSMDDTKTSSATYEIKLKK